MKRYKFKDKLPPDNIDIFCYLPIGIGKTTEEIIYDRFVGCCGGTIIYSNEEEFNIEEYGDIEWLDESEEEITDTQRIEWLDANSTRIDYIAEEQDKTLIIEYNIRDIIDKQIKEENENI